MQDDPRFRKAVALLNEGEYFDAADAFEELFFEAIRDEVEPVRALMQVAVGMHHVERGEARAAIERLEEAVLAIDRSTNAHGLDFAALREAVVRAISQLRAHEKVTRVITRERP